MNADATPSAAVRLLAATPATSITLTHGGGGGGGGVVSGARALALTAAIVAGTTLDLHKKRLRVWELPAGTDGLRLTELKLDSNKIVRVTRTHLAAVRNLTKLEMSCNKIAELPVPLPGPPHPRTHPPYSRVVLPVSLPLHP